MKVAVVPLVADFGASVAAICYVVRIYTHAHTHTHKWILECLRDAFSSLVIARQLENCATRTSELCMHINVIAPQHITPNWAELRRPQTIFTSIRPQTSCALV